MRQANQRRLGFDKPPVFDHNFPALSHRVIVQLAPITLPATNDYGRWFSLGARHLSKHFFFVEDTFVLGVYCCWAAHVL